MTDRIAGGCECCAGAFGAVAKVVVCGVTLARGFKGRPSFKKLINQGYQIIAF